MVRKIFINFSVMALALFNFAMAAPALMPEPHPQLQELPADLTKTILYPKDQAPILLEGYHPELRSIKLILRQPKLDLKVMGEYPNLKTIEIDGSYGAITAFLDGQFPELKKINIIGGTARVLLDVSGAHAAEKCNLYVGTTLGRVMLYLPDHADLFVKVDTHGGRIIREGLNRRFFWKSNEFYARSESPDGHKMKVKIKTGKGNITLNIGSRPDKKWNNS